MITVKVLLNEIGKVKDFVSKTTKCEFYMDLVSGRYVIDAKSIMGIFSLELARPLTLNIHCEEGEKGLKEFIESINAYIVD